jgi:hypothetical protein
MVCHHRGVYGKSILISEIALQQKRFGSNLLFIEEGRNLSFDKIWQRTDYLVNVTKTS